MISVLNFDSNVNHRFFFIWIAEVINALKKKKMSSPAGDFPSLHPNCWVEQHNRLYKKLAWVFIIEMITDTK